MVLASHISRKLLASAFLVIAASLAVLDVDLSRYAAQREIEDARRRLTIEAQILKAELDSVPATGVERWSLDAGGRAQAWVTLINPQGVVLADSQRDPETTENHAQGPEIRQAYAGEIGSSIRHSDTLNRDLCYLAVPVDYGGQAGYVLRLALPLEDRDAATRAVHLRILEASLAATLVALLLAYLFSRSFTSRIQRLQNYAENLVERDGAQGRLPAGDDELGALGRSLAQASTQLRRLVDGLSLESARHEAILSSMVEGVLAVDADLRVTFCNRSFGRLIGASDPIPARAALVELVRDPALIEMISNVLRSGQSHKQRLQLPAAQGRSFEVQVTPLAASPGAGAIAILHDITDLERLERVRRDFVANVSHELRTPLTAIRGYAETLLEGALEDKENNRRFLEVINAHAIRLGLIARDLLILSELESVQTPTESERVSVRNALQSALRAVETEARARQVKVILDEIEDVQIRGSRVRLEQALVNLLDNALKFNRPGGEVRVRSCRTDGYARISITDTGIGIPSEDLARIFERFYRVDKARSSEVGGTGLGLSIVKHTIERMQGTIEVESRLGKGSTFTVQLPVAPTSETDSTLENRRTA